MKKIHLNGPAVDNAGQYVDAGADLVVSKDAKPGVIAPERAKAIIEGGGAIEIAEEKAGVAK